MILHNASPDFLRKQKSSGEDEMDLNAAPGFDFLHCLGKTLREILPLF
jgi:hypothetical protein